MTNALSTLIRNWTGPLPPPVVRRRASARWETNRAAAAGLTVRVAEIVEETPTVRTFVLEPIGPALTYEAGQHVTVIVTIGTETLRRCYSFSTSPLAGGRPAITVRRVADGRVSSHLHDRVRVGDTLRVAAPSGTFTLPAGGRDARRFAMLAGGVGVTPLMSLAETALRRDAATEVDLLCGHRCAEEIVFRDRLAALETEFGSRLRIRIALADA